MCRQGCLDRFIDRPLHYDHYPARRAYPYPIAFHQFEMPIPTHSLKNFPRSGRQIFSRIRINEERF